VQLVSRIEYLSLWQLVVATIGMGLVALECGFRLGTRRGRAKGGEKELTVSASVGATLGLLGFMLAMTFGVALGQFDMRRQAFLEEVNALGTAYNRADLLPVVLRERSKVLLREYVRTRLYAVDTGDVRGASLRSEALQRQLWSTVTTAKETSSDLVSFGLYAQSIGAVFDAHTRRMVAAFQSRIPTVIWLVLFGVAALGIAEMGYQAGLSGSTRSPAHVGLVVSLAAVLWIVADLDRPQEGAIKVSQKFMRDLEQMMEDPS
jgi:hypothetical protein